VCNIGQEKIISDVIFVNLAILMILGKRGKFSNFSERVAINFFLKKSLNLAFLTFNNSFIICP
jgi:hypothetical protein